MPQRELILQGDVPPALVTGLQRLADQLHLPNQFPPEVTTQVAGLVTQGPWDKSPRDDLTSIPFFTLDPAGSMDLDQAVFIERQGDGFRVWYAIVDVAAWVTPGGATDAEAHRRGQTYYAPQTRLPLHPFALSEGAASLLPDGQPRPANVWRMDLDGAGAVTNFAVIRANAVSRAKLNYDDSQKAIDAGTADEPMQLLKTVGQLRLQQEAARGGVSLNLPEQDVVTDGSHWRLALRNLAPIENWNAQISLLTGFCAASLMRHHGLGILRTLPPVSDSAVSVLRHIAGTLNLSWPHDVSYAAFVRGLDAAKPADQAMMNACTVLFRGAGYVVIGSAADSGDMPHGALASEYAHTTAPLRRLVDRYTGTICACLASGLPVPDWARDGLSDLPVTMEESDRRAKSLERGVVGLTEALTLSGRVGQRFTGVVISVDPRDSRRGVASIPSVAVEAPVTSEQPLVLGADATMTLTRADVAKGQVAFEVCDS